MQQPHERYNRHILLGYRQAIVCHVNMEECYHNTRDTVLIRYMDTVSTSYVYIKTGERYIAKGDTGSDFYGYTVENDPNIIVKGDTVETFYLYAAYAEKEADSFRATETAYSYFACSSYVQTTSGALPTARRPTAKTAYNYTGYSRRKGRRQTPRLHSNYIVYIVYIDFSRLALSEAGC